MIFYLYTMKRKIVLILMAVSMAGGMASACATEGQVAIISPVDGSTVSSARVIHVSYVATFDKTGDHVHLYIDGQGHETLRDMAISRTVESFEDGKWQLVSREFNDRKAVGPLSPGRHEICIKVVDRMHKPTGLEKCIHVLSE